MLIFDDVDAAFTDCIFHAIAAYAAHIIFACHCFADAMLPAIIAIFAAIMPLPPRHCCH